MKALEMILGIGAIAAVAGVAIAASKDDDDESKSVPPARNDEPEMPRLPRLPKFPTRPAPSLPAIPASPVQIPGGTYIDNVGWCPPGYIYDYASNMCTPMIVNPLPPGIGNSLNVTAGTGTCCAACERGEECEGC